jgi:TRAP-type C4-dicarboxylate transport system permease small subunit
MIMLQKAHQIEKRMETILTVVSSVVTISLTLMIVVDVTGRYFLNRPLPATWEIGEICMPYIVFFPFAYALTRGNHVQVGLIKNMFSRKVQRIFGIITDIISLALCIAMTYWAWLRFWESFKLQEEMLAAVKILWWWGKIAMPIGIGLFTISFFFQLIYKLKQK